MRFFVFPFWPKNVIVAKTDKTEHNAEEGVAMSLVKARREEAGLTLTEVARRADMLCSKVWKIEHDHRRLTLADAARLARAIGCTVGDFLPDGGPRRRRIGRRTPRPAALGRQA
jgi:hypothetical protein